jgi:Ig-like domain CHU_C associated
MKNCLNASAMWFAMACSVCLFPNQVNAQIPQLTVTRITSPIHCLGQSYYKFVIQASGGVVSVNKGIIVADTIKNVEEGSTPLIVTVTAPNGQKVQETIQLPAVDAFPPQPAIVASYSVCENDPLPKLSAIVISPNTTVDWYNQPIGGSKVATGSLTYQPTEAATYYALSRDSSTGCVAAIKTAATVIVKKSACTLVMTVKVRI